MRAPSLPPDARPPRSRAPGAGPRRFAVPRIRRAPARALVRLAGLAAALVAALPALAFDLQGHRGARGLAPENTLTGFAVALRIGVSTLETDLALTRDDVLVLSHDPRLNGALTRGEDGRWLGAAGPALRSLRFDELQRFDVGRIDPASRYAAQWPGQVATDGERIPTLDALFRLVAQDPTRGTRVRFNLETKIAPDSGEDVAAPAHFARTVVDAVRAAGMADRVTIQSFDWRTLLEVRRIAPAIPTACLTMQTDRNDTVRPGPDGASPWHAGLRLADHGGSLPRLVRAAGCTTWSMYWPNLTPELAAEARSLGLKLVPWTVNEPAQMHRLIGLGVDGLITDYPDRLRTVMRERGLPLP